MPDIQYYYDYNKCKTDGTYNKLKITKMRRNTGLSWAGVFV